MNISLIYYSPTNTTQTILKQLAQELKPQILTEIDLTKAGNTDLEIDNEDICIIGAPVYGGRIALTAIERLKEIKADNAKAVLVAVYGNRAYEDALLELKDTTTECGFDTIAAAAFIAEHSFSTTEKPIAHSRPDKDDFVKIADFAQELKAKVDSESFTTPTIPGNFPHKDRSQLPALAPQTVKESCIDCGKCISVCPTDAIEVGGKTNTELCTWCFACIKACPNEGRVFDNPSINGLKDKLFNLCSERKEPEFFL